MTVAVIGCGFIGHAIAKFIDEEMGGEIHLKIIYDEITQNAMHLWQTLNTKPRVAEDLGTILSDDSVELVIEAASRAAAKSIVPRALAAGKNVMIMSVGALADSQFYRDIVSIAQKHKLRIYVPSGRQGASIGLRPLR